MSNTPALPTDSAFAVFQQAATALDHHAAGEYAMELVKLPDMEQPIPRFFLDLPWSDDSDAVVHQILVNLAGAEDITAATSDAKLRKIEDICGRPVTVFDVRVRETDVPDAKWGAYLSLAVSVDNGPQEAISSGHAQVAVTLWRCYCEGRFPVSGVFRKLGSPTKGRNQPIGFQIEEAL